ncbi:hypothetical protein BGW80DRAFT_1413844 [Lactifluus volemus]|nr:hypothetical protein BGW80DRAFT_1413844 [Lactifluus volemus]
MEFLPNLEVLTHSSGTPDVHDALTLFVSERQAAGHPVHLQHRSSNVVGQYPERPRWHTCDVCGARFATKQARKRHIEDSHRRPGTCPNCLSFTWPRSRPHLLKVHQEKCHMPSDSHD